jgi:chemotaxis protein methyltransferase WspC
MPLTDIEQLLWRSMGLDSATVGISTIHRAVLDRMKACRLATVDAYWEYLRDSTSELQELVERVVVPETWFFRDEDAFAALVPLATGLLQDRPTEVLRILSVPCSTGEEPYSIAMALRDGEISRKQITVDAVDISGRALAYSRRGVYGRNSFRSRSLGFRDRHFHQVADGYAVADWMSQVVTFHQANLVSGQFSPPNSPYDVIFCRNLLIYFDRSTQERAMRTLDALLAPAGILFVGPAEAFLAATNSFASVNGAASFAFRKSSAKAPEPVRAAPPRLRTQLQRKPILPEPPRAKRRLPSVVDSREAPPADLATAQRLADQGQLRDAADCCERNIAQYGPSAEAYYLLGVVQDVSGERDRASECYRRTVYLEPNHVEALIHMALLSERQGDNSSAQRLRERAQRAGASLECKQVTTL